MSKKVICFFIVIFSLVFFGSAMANPKPSSAAFLNKYHSLRTTKPDQAKIVLRQGLENYPDNIMMNKEMGYFLLKENNYQEALKFFNNVLRLDPKDQQIELQVAYIYVSLKQTEKAKSIFKSLLASSDSTIQKRAQQGLASLAPKKTTVSISTYDTLMNRYYSLKKRHPLEARKLLRKILRLYPNKTDALKEMGYGLLNENRHSEALPYFLRAEKLEPNDIKLKLQIAYIYDKLKRYNEAYEQFAVVARSTTCEEGQVARTAMINLAPYRYKILPQPLFADLYFDPFYQGRFNNMIYPLKLRFGAEFGEHKEVKVYGVIRYTRDKLSSGGLLPDIYEDNVFVYGIGASLQPFVSLPVVLYVEGGRAYDLVDRNRPRWRKDLRSGVIGYKYWGRPLLYACDLRFPFKYVNDFYGDISYFSRFDDNIIGQLRMRPGLRILEFYHSNVDVYLKLQGFFDKNHEFYNNVFEVGPGISFMPYNQLPFRIRIERIRGNYIDVNSPSPNPYGKHYDDTRIQAEIYLLI